MSSRKRKKRTPLGPAWLADMTIAFKGWQVALPLAVLSWMWRHWRGVGSVVLAALLFVWTGEPVLAGMSLFVVYGAAKWKPAKRKARWWDQETLAAAFVASGILSANGDRLPDIFGKGKMFSRRGQPVHNDHGTTVQVSLPQAKTLADVVKSQTRLASALKVPENRLTITQEPDDNANVVRIHVSSPTRKSATPPVVNMERTDWAQPFRVGVDSRGREVKFQTTETHSVIAGATGSGKSVLAKLAVSHAALDPRVRLYGIDGKGDTGAKGWEYLEPICEAFVRGMGPDSPARVEAMLREVYELSEQRGQAGREAPEIVLILEEWASAQTVLASLDRACAERCGKLVTVLMATSRSRGVHILPITQRGTTESLPGEQRANLGQRFVGKFPDRKEPGYVLEGLPARLPSRAGEFLVSLDGQPPTLFAVDELKPEAWRKVCRRAVALRTPARPALTLASPLPLPPAAGEGLVSEVVTILADAPKGLPASQIHRRLSDETREAVGSDRNLGVALTQFPDVVTRVYAGSGRAWRLNEGADSSAKVW